MGIQTGKLNLDPKLQYDIVVAALDLVGSVPRNVHNRVERAVRLGTNTSRPTVEPSTLTALVDVLNRVQPGMNLGDDVIARSDAQRAARRAR